MGCGDNDDCRGILICQLREGTAAVLGCSGSPTAGQNYCVNPNPDCWLPYLLNPPTKAPTKPPTQPTTLPPGATPPPSRVRSYPWPDDRPTVGVLINYPECPPGGCPVCTSPTNGCDGHEDCASGLLCWNERQNGELIPGCDGKGIWWMEYCFDPTDNTYPLEVLEQPAQPAQSGDVYFTHTPTLPERCETFAANIGGTVNVPFSGTSSKWTFRNNHANLSARKIEFSHPFAIICATGVGSTESLYGDVTYIFLMDTSGSTNKLKAECGQRNADETYNKVLDCEVWAIEEIQKAILQNGNVDLEGLAWFGDVGSKKDYLVTPWNQTTGRRDSIFVEFARTLQANGLTNYEAGVEQACDLVNLPTNDNPSTVVIMVSDGKPNRGKSVKDLLQNRCKGAVFHTFAVTDLADCYGIDTAELGLTDDPDTLYEIAEYTGGTCSKVVDATTLPGLLAALEKTTWEGVRVLLNGNEPLKPFNGTEILAATVVYANNPGFEGPKNTTYQGSVPVGPGEWDLCVEAMSSTSGVVKRIQNCTKINVLTIQANTPLYSGGSASIMVNVVSLGPNGGCDTPLQDTPVTVKDCKSNTTVVTLTPGTDGKVNFETYHAAGIDCFYFCITDASTNSACTMTDLEWPVSTVTTHFAERTISCYSSDSHLFRFQDNPKSFGNAHSNSHHEHDTQQGSF